MIRLVHFIIRDVISKLPISVL